MLRPVRRVGRVVPVVRAREVPVVHERWGPVVRAPDRRVRVERERPVAREDLVVLVRVPLVPVLRRAVAVGPPGVAGDREDRSERRLVVDVATSKNSSPRR